MNSAPHPNELAARQRIDALRARPTPPAVEVALSDPHWMVRLAASELAATCVEPHRLVELMALGDDFARRASAINALVRAGPRALPALLAAMRAPNATAHVFCLQALARIPCEQSFAALCLAARSPDTLVSQAALDGLGQQGDPRAVPVLREALGKDQWRALSAIVALGHLDAPEARPLLASLETDERYGEAAADALRRHLRRTGVEARA